MAYSTLVSLENTIAQILHPGRYSISAQEKLHIISLNEHVVSFRAYLEDFPGKSKDFEARIRSVTAEAEDIIELYMMEQIRYGFRYTKWISDLRRIKFRYEIHKVKDVMDSMDGEMVAIKNRIKIKDSPLDDSHEASSSSQVAAPGNIKMVGLDKDLLEIENRLRNEESNLQCVPIYGMGGIGKTTLARNAYDHRSIMYHFDIRAWVTISQDYSETRVLLDLLDSMKDFDPEQRKGSMAQERSEKGNETLAEIPELSYTQISVKVHQILKGRRFLIVLDDVKLLLPNDGNGSRIMLTTRLAAVASYADSSIPVHKMSLMDADQSWNLLQQKVLGHQDHISGGLESIGREIARSCGGLPLAIVVVAGLLSTMSKTSTAWDEIAQNVKSSLATADGQIENIVSLSYNHLPQHLRSCFLFMGGFPEDHEIKVTDLIRLWIAESFVSPHVSKRFVDTTEESKRLEDTAEEYLEDLVDRSLIVVTKRKSNGKIKCCRLHDIVREICIKLSQEEKFLLHIEGRGAMKLVQSMKYQRRISLSNSDLNSFSIFSSKIRTMLYFQDSLDSFGSFRLLRVLNVLRVRFKSRVLPDQFFELFHLRYLALPYDEQIPRAISNLQRLQTLIIKVSMYHPLPIEIWNMPELRHVTISGCWLLDPRVSTLALPNLQTLYKVKNLTCSVSILNMFPNLKKLKLTYFRGSGELHLHNLAHLHKLEKLQLELEIDCYESPDPNLVGPRSLKKLTLIGWGHHWPCINIAGPFPNLEVLKLIKFNFVGGAWTTSGEGFPELKFLLLDTTTLRQWNIICSHFPKLEVLLLRSCWRLQEIPYDIVYMSTLKLMELRLCSKSLADSAKQVEEEWQRVEGGDAFQVRCIDCEDSKELEESASNLQLESVRKPKKIVERKTKNWSNRTIRLMHWGLIPQSSPVYTVERYDSREADLKIADNKDKESRASKSSYT